MVREPDNKSLRQSSILAAAAQASQVLSLAWGGPVMGTRGNLGKVNCVVAAVSVALRPQPMVHPATGCEGSVPQVTTTVCAVLSPLPYLCVNHTRLWRDCSCEAAVCSDLKPGWAGLCPAETLALPHRPGGTAGCPVVMLLAGPWRGS